MLIYLTLTATAFEINTVIYNEEMEAQRGYEEAQGDTASY